MEASGRTDRDDGGDVLHTDAYQSQRSTTLPTTGAMRLEGSPMIVVAKSRRRVADAYRTAFVQRSPLIAAIKQKSGWKVRLDLFPIASNLSPAAIRLAQQMIGRYRASA
jgi:hypothetical protein